MQAVVVAGALANKPHNGGEAWVRLSWVLGFLALGLDAYLVEEIAADRCVDVAGDPVAFDASTNLAYFRQVIDRFGLRERASLICGNGDAIAGLDRETLLRLAGDALLVNISGNLQWPALFDRFRRTVYVDIDPGFTQAWHASGELPHLHRHDLHYTLGENIGRRGCSIPAGDVAWRPVRQPVVLADWPRSTDGAPDRFTTVARWRAPFGAPELGGRRFGLKHHEFRKFIDIPAQIPQTCELALSIDPADGRDLDLLRAHGWNVVDPISTAGDPDDFRRYVQTSGGELSVAQGVYVDTHSGWFSDRTVRYLASGKPALVQDTGFVPRDARGAGVVPFRTLDDVVAGAASIRERYDEHCAAARAIAEEHFDSTKVLGRFAEETGLVA
jgi:hypothetical protein